jgi:hypothetical protein
MRRLLKENGLALFFGALFAFTITAQSFAGQHAYNAGQLEHGGSAVSWWGFVRSPEYWGAVMENWQSEFLQFSLFIAATVWLVQKGSNESKELGDAGTESDERQRTGRHADERSPLWARIGGFRTAIYSNSLLIVMTTIFFASWFAQSLNNWRRLHDLPAAARLARVEAGRRPSRRDGVVRIAVHCSGMDQLARPGARR